MLYRINNFINVNINREREREFSIHVWCFLHKIYLNVVYDIFLKYVYSFIYIYIYRCRERESFYL